MSLRGEAEKAYEFFKTHGWTQGELMRWTSTIVAPSYCLEGCFMYGPGKANQLRSLAEEALERMGWELHVLGGEGLYAQYPWIMWNDIPGRTREEVDDFFKLMLEIAEEKDKAIESLITGSHGSRDYSEESRLVSV